MTPDSSLPDRDEALAAALAADPAPPTPAGLPLRVRRKLQRRRLVRRTAAGLAAVLLLAAGMAAWQLWPHTGPHTEIAHGARPDPAAIEADPPDPAFLGSAPPVDTLDVLAQRQAAYLTVLDHLEKEF